MLNKLDSTILYTALLGNYDELKSHIHPKQNSFCFTDNLDIFSDSWTLIAINNKPKSLDERIRMSRKIKTHPHNLLPNHSISIWVDASMQLNENYKDLIKYIEFEDLATFKYPSIWGARECAYEEAISCIQRGKDAEDIIKKQMGRYRNCKYPINNGLVETSILVRKNSKEVRLFNENWWQEISNGSRRDQLSFNYCCWRLNLKYCCIPGHRLQNPFANYIKHKELIYSGYPVTSKEIH